MRKTKIIATLGPCSENEDIITQLIENGVDIFRLNLSHNIRKWHMEMIEKIKNISSQTQILLDTRGPEIRLGDFAGQVDLKKGEIFELYCQQKPLNEKIKSFPISFKKIHTTLKFNEKIALDSGMLFARVIKIDNFSVQCEALSDWVLTSRRHVNLPGERVDLPTISQLDREDLEVFANNQKIDFFAISFTRSAKDIENIKKVINKQKIIAKIENFEGVNNFSEILVVSDGVMIARGDLGVEMPLEQIPVLQRKMIKEARLKNKFSIVATEMLESMINLPRPTRAEISDIATGVWEGADCLMLSGETANGKFPIKAVEIMRKVIDYTENEMFYL